MRCHYEVLELTRNCSPEEIKRSYKKLALQWHPDKNPDRVQECQARFTMVKKAYDVLSDPTERAWYDKHREDILKAAIKSVPTSRFVMEHLNLQPSYIVNLVDGFSVDENSDIFLDGRGKNQLKQPKPSEIYLLEGFELMFHGANKGLRLNLLLKWALKRAEDNPKIKTVRGLFCQSDFVGDQSVFMSIAKSPYDFLGALKSRAPCAQILPIVAVSYKGVIFLLPYEGTSYIEEMNDMFRQRQGYAGRKFEQALTSSEAWESSRESPAALLHSGYKAVSQFKVGSRSLLMSSTVDAFDADGNMVELLLSKRPRHRGQAFTFKRDKCLSLYLQHLITGVGRKLVIGLRNLDTLEFEGYHTLEDAQKIPAFCRENPCPRPAWKAENCIGFLEHFLTQLESEMREMPELTYVEWEPDLQTQSWIRSDAEVSEAKRFLPEWFLAKTKDM